VDLANRGYTQEDIAAELQVTQAAVSKILRRVQDRALQELTTRIAREKVRQTSQLQYVVRESLRQWEQSKADATTRRQRKTGAEGEGGGAGGTVAEITVASRHGDPRFLDVARRALADQRRIWGLDAPRQVQVQEGDPYAALSEAELLDLIAEQDALLQGHRRGPR
jgi:transcriptional regulator with XRE-family HTH domain